MSSIHRLPFKFIGALVFFLVSSLVACRPVDAVPDLNDPSQTGRHPKAVVLHTNDTWAYYDPCG